MIKKMERENLLIRVETFTPGILKMINFMEREFIITRMEMNTKANGQITNKMERESLPGKITIYMMGISRMV